MNGRENFSSVGCEELAVIRREGKERSKNDPPPHFMYDLIAYVVTSHVEGGRGEGRVNFQGQGGINGVNSYPTESED